MAAVRIGQDTDGQPFALDLEHLVETRLLIQANSGAGKSWTLRRLLEQSFGKVQHLVIDPEGEFASLRERYDYVLAGRGGDTAAEPRSAKLLARRLLELRVSAILDIYELKAHDRVRFVRYFLEALVDAPKELWHPVLVVVDEAHIYAPQKGEAESLSAVVELAGRGRKRGFCAVLATRRIALLHKDAAAELNNKLIGRSSLDIDMRRSAEELGFTAREDQQSLRSLKPGQFFAFGPALSDTVTRVEIGPVETTHPKVGSRHLVTPPPAREKVKRVLAKLADLPAEAEQERQDAKELRSDNATLRRQLTQAQGAQPADPQDLQRRVREATQPLQERLSGVEDTLVERQATLTRLLALLASVPDELQGIAERLRSAVNGHQVPPTRRPRPQAAQPQPARRERVPELEAAPSAAPPESAISRPQMRILDALAAFEPLGVRVIARSIIAAYAGVSPRSSGFENNLSRLRTLGLIDYPASGQLALTDAGQEMARPESVISSVNDLHEAWFRILSRPQAAILKLLIDAFPEHLSRENVALEVGVSPSSSGFENNLSRLRSLRLIDYPLRGFVTATQMLWPEGVPA